jgi:hypothetical protein
MRFTPPPAGLDPPALRREANTGQRHVDAMAHALRIECGTLMQLNQRDEINDEMLHCVLRDTDLREVSHRRRAHFWRAPRGGSRSARSPAQGVA